MEENEDDEREMNDKERRMRERRFILGKECGKKDRKRVGEDEAEGGEKKKNPLKDKTLCSGEY